MTREEAVTRAQNALNDPIAKGGGAAMLDLDTLRALISGPIPDPVTGLVPCGCGGKAELGNYLKSISDNQYYVYCPICYTRTDLKETKNYAMESWNFAMGYEEEA